MARPPKNFPSSNASLAVALTALFLIVFGAGLLLLGLPPRGPEVVRGVAFLLVAIAYGGVWLAVAMLFSVVFRSTATSASVRARPVAVLLPAVADDRPGDHPGLHADTIRSVDEVLSLEQFSSALQRLSPGTLFGEAVLGLLQPETKAFGDFANLVMAARHDPRHALAVRSKPALDLAADHGPDCRHDRGLLDRLYRVPARGSQGLKDWTVTAALNNARWCNAVCFAHGTARRFLAHTWVNAEPVPRFYPNAVTLTPGEADIAEQRQAVRILQK